MTNNIPKISYVPNPLYFQNSQLIGKMQISRKAEFSDFSEKYSDILQVLPYRNKKIWMAMVAEPFFFCF